MEPEKRKYAKDIDGFLTCFECTEYLTEPVRQCSYGHPICNECIIKNEKRKCPVCQVSIRVMIENKAITLLIMTRKRRCKFSLCKERVAIGKLKEHIKDCQYNKYIQCPAIHIKAYSSENCDCDKTLNIDNVERHLMKKHKVPAQSGGDSFTVRYEDSSRENLKDTIFFKGKSGSFVIAAFNYENFCVFRVVPINKGPITVKIIAKNQDSIYEASKSTDGINGDYRFADFCLVLNDCILFGESGFIKFEINAVSNN